ncbi:MAG: RsmE family RNA methyltransferase [Treponemataceae bacterium]
MNIVLFEKFEIDKPLSLKDERSLHIQKILHKQEGETFDAGIIGERAGKALITLIDENGIHFDFTPLSDGKQLFPLSVIIGFTRPIQLRRIFRDMAGLGVQRIILTGTELGEKSYMKSDMVSGGQAMLLLKEGSVQAKSTHIPELLQYPTLKTCLDFLHTNFDVNSTFATEDKKKLKPLLIALDNVDADTGLTDFCQKINGASPVVAAVGSERGWTDNERKLLKSKGFTLCSMGERILRTETAATVACSVILSKMGFLN